MRIERRYTKAGESAYQGIDFRTTKSEIRNPDGSVVFRLDDIEVPSAWSQVAADILAQKYFRKAGVPAKLKRVEENDVPSFLWRSVPDEAALAALPEAERTVSEHDARQVFDRLAGTWTYWGWKGGYFAREEDAQTFFDELRYMLATQKAAPNSPQWFNTGLHWAYGIDGPSQGHYYVDHKTGAVLASESAYEHPQPHACFIQSVADDLVNEGGIMDLWVREARLFKYGSGTGTNFSSLRGEGERLSGGGKSSGLMSFLKIGDRAAGAIKSGGTTRRAAKMVVVDIDHPDIETFVNWKVKEEQKVAALVTGSRIIAQHLKAVMKACINCEGDGDDCFDPLQEPGAEARGARRQEGAGAGELHPPRHPVREAGLHRHRVPDLRHRLGLGGLSHRRRAELEQHGAGHRRVPRCGGEGQGLEPHRAHHRQGDEDAQGARSVGDGRLCRLGLGRPRHPVPHHDQRLAHLRGERRHPRLEPVLGVHVPRRHGLQPRLAQPSPVPRRGEALRHRRLRACGAAVDGRPRDLRADGAVPGEEDRRALLPVPHARPRLRQYRRPPDVGRHSLRFQGRPRALRRHHGADDRHRLRHLGRDGGRARPLPRLCREPRRHAPRHAQPPARRLRLLRRL